MLKLNLANDYNFDLNVGFVINKCPSKHRPYPHWVGLAKYLGL